MTMIDSNRLLFRMSSNAVSFYDFSIDEMKHFLADAEIDIVWTGTDISQTDTDKAIFLNRG